METKDVLGLGLGATGTVLGVINLYRSWSADRVKLRVMAFRPRSAAGNEHLVGVQVDNLCGFEITLADVGFGGGKGLPNQAGRIALRQFVNAPADSLPLRMQARSSFTGIVNASNGAVFVHGRYAYAITQDGTAKWAKQALE